MMAHSWRRIPVWKARSVGSERCIRGYERQRIIPFGRSVERGIGLKILSSNAGIIIRKRATPCRGAGRKRKRSLDAREMWEMICRRSRGRGKSRPRVQRSRGIEQHREPCHRARRDPANSLWILNRQRFPSLWPVLSHFSRVSSKNEKKKRKRRYFKEKGEKRTRVLSIIFTFPFNV